MIRLLLIIPMYVSLISLKGQSKVTVFGYTEIALKEVVYCPMDVFFKDSCENNTTGLFYVDTLENCHFHIWNKDTLVLVDKRSALSIASESVGVSIGKRRMSKSLDKPYMERFWQEYYEYQINEVQQITKTGENFFSTTSIFDRSEIVIHDYDSPEDEIIYYKNVTAPKYLFSNENNQLYGRKMVFEKVLSIKNLPYNVGFFVSENNTTYELVEKETGVLLMLIRLSEPFDIIEILNEMKGEIDISKLVTHLRDQISLAKSMKNKQIKYAKSVDSDEMNAYAIRKIASFTILSLKRDTTIYNATNEFNTIFLYNLLDR